MSFTFAKRAWLTAVAACCSLSIAGSAFAQCASYTVSNGTVAYQSGTTDVTNHGDDVSTIITTPFPITFFGTTYASGASVRVCSNGFMQMVSTTSSTAFTNANLPATTVSGPALMPYWDDLNTSTTTPLTKGIFTAVIGATPTRQWVIEWRVGTGTSGVPITSMFEIVFYEGSNDFDFVYGTPLASTASATIGIQSSGTAGSTANVLGFNVAGTVASGASRHFTCVAPGTGACCANTGVCSVVASTSCTSPSIYQGNNSVCNAGNTCTSATVGSCCNTTTAACTFVASSTACASPSVYTAGGACSPNTCAPVGSCCNTSTFVCTAQTAATCAFTFVASPATCTTNPCPAPANDLCANAIVLSGTGPFPLQTLGQDISSADTTALSPAVCASSSRDVWYSFTPASGALSYTFTTCNSVTNTGTLAGGAFDTVLSIHSACPITGANNLQTGLASNCNDDSCTGGIGASTIPGLTLTAGQTYLIRVAGFSTTNFGNFRLDIISEPYGACCSSTSSCILSAQSACTGTNVFVGGGTLCNTSGICNGACCNTATAVCTFTTAASCTGTHGGVGSVCSTTFCPTTTCCNDATGACTTTGTAACPAGTTNNGTGTCTASPCRTTTCCNDATGTCTLTGTAACPAGTTANAAATCTPTPCTTSTCCNTTTGACTVTGGAACAAGSVANAAATCSPQPCPQPTACCSAGGCCTLAFAAGCTGTSGTALTCSPNPCTGAAPANDACAGATSIALNSAVVAESCLATAEAGDVAGTCTAGTFASMWWAFTAPHTGTFTASTCGSSYDTVLNVFSGSCAALASVGCNDDTCGLQSTISNLAFTAGQTYLIRVGSFSTATGTINLIVTANNPAGSCCNVSACTATDSLACAGTFTAAGTCTPNPCPQPGTCCDTAGVCSFVLQASCTGTFTVGGSCTPNPCLPPGVCCRGSTCTTTITNAADCAASLSGTAGSSFPAGAACNGAPVSNTPCCYGDYNKVNGITVNDIFNFLSDWFAGVPYARTGGNGDATPLTVQNIFDFLSNWFAGCP